jgi:heme-degrading monooxygenase HmoA/ketosteroid isomerase-like protein
MNDRRLIVFRSRLQSGDQSRYHAHAASMYERAQAMPGFVSAKDFTAEDGERVNIIEWESGDTLAGWRDDPTHQSAMNAGREGYYAEYSIHVTSILRSARFQAGGAVARTNDDPAALRTLAETWLACFERRDLDGLLALYADDATHTSPKIRVRHPETGGVLRGKAAMRAWWQDSFDRIPSMKYVPTSITADRQRVYFEYVREVAGKDPYPVCETLDVRDGKIIASRVFHG